MSIEIKKITDSEQTMSVRMEKEELDKYFEEILKEEAKKMTIEGFRKGKAPLSLIRKMYGESLFYANLDKIANNKFWDEIDIRGINVLFTPSITKLNLNSEGGLNFEVQFETPPEFELINLEEIEVEKNEYELTESYLQKVMNYVQFELREEQDADEISSEDFITKLSFQELDEANNEIPNKNPREIFIYLKNENLPKNILEKLLNKKKNDNFEIELDIDKFLTTLEGKEFTANEFPKKYRVTISDIKKVNLLPISDELAKKYFGEENKTLEDLKKYIEEKETKYYEKKSKDEFVSNLEKILIEKHNFNPPPTVVQRMKDQIINDMSKRYKVSKDAFLTDETLKANIEQSALNSTKYFYIKEKLLNQLDIKIEDSDLDKDAETFASRIQKTKEETLEILRKNKNYIDSKLTEKLFDEIGKKVKVKTNKITL